MVTFRLVGWLANRLPDALISVFYESARIILRPQLHGWIELRWNDTQFKVQNLLVWVVLNEEHRNIQKKFTPMAKGCNHLVHSL